MLSQKASVQLQLGLACDGSLLVAAIHPSSEIQFQQDTPTAAVGCDMQAGNCLLPGVLG